MEFEADVEHVHPEAVFVKLEAGTAGTAEGGEVRIGGNLSRVHNPVDMAGGPHYIVPVQERVAGNQAKVGGEVDAGGEAPLGNNGHHRTVMVADVGRQSQDAARRPCDGASGSQ